MSESSGTDMEEKMVESESCSIDTCSGCEACTSGICASCGMPMNGPDDFGGGDTENRFCVHCCHPDGTHKSFDEVLEGMTGLMMQRRGMDHQAAATAARDYLVTMPAWEKR